ncbi:peptidoglycan DD-metalloendopeptidase family protein [Pusillimonas sp. ANT_WB101]|uniref:peptidoglycan DD-metalloendopeptidase family protein n=1 Tax=Pusillimonas sp. ANT_WB101 TaxID=2597356 RepID=UPI002103BE67|nr:peptidoglycan DD-metalloendopeptidase family protein [Pusillimonas sp. ANT_WB101]
MHTEIQQSGQNAFFRNARPESGRLALVAVAVAAALLAGCAAETQAPITDMTGGKATTSSATGTYVVKPGDTLYQIAQAHSMTYADLARINNITDPSQLKPGQVLRVTGKAAPAASTSAGPAQTIPVTPVQPVTPAAPVDVPRASDAATVNWGWPASTSGKIIQDFNANTKGIDISGAIGDPVYAAADGDVMYAGNGVRGLGNLILLGHGNSFVTAYAHNHELKVKTGQKVKKGDQIATLGQTDTSSPRLHFEIRRGGTPVNPMSYLPKR